MGFVHSGGIIQVAPHLEESAPGLRSKFIAWFLTGVFLASHFAVLCSWLQTSIVATLYLRLGLRFALYFRALKSSFISNLPCYEVS